MTDLLERAFSEAAALSEAEQDALAARILAEIEDERAWDQRFEATTDEQWDELAAFARREIEDDDSASLDELVRGRRDWVARHGGFLESGSGRTRNTMVCSNGSEYVVCHSRDSGRRR